MSQKVVPLISLAKNFDQNFILHMKFLKDVYHFCFMGTCVQKFINRYAFFAFLSHSVGHIARRVPHDSF